MPDRTPERRLGDVVVAAEYRTPAIEQILTHGKYGPDLPPELRLVAAYDTLVNYAKAMALGDDCQNPLDRGESRR